MPPEFKVFSKIPRLSRNCTITEKLDGTNAQVNIRPAIREDFVFGLDTQVDDLYIRAGSRNRWISTQDDNFGFARWVWENAEELLQLGVGAHYGEWWGQGIQRGYGLAERRFSLFNTNRWVELGTPLAKDDERREVPKCCSVVPILFQGMFHNFNVDLTLRQLDIYGSRAALGFRQPEGVVIYHEASGQLFKKTLEHDERPKEAHPPRSRQPQQLKPKNRGGRRILQVPIDFLDRRLVSTTTEKEALV